MGAPLIYHICTREDWEAAKAAGRYEGSSRDQADGFIHFSSAENIEQTAARYRAGQHGLLLLGVESEALAGDLKWEAARDGVPFPHLYGALPLTALRAVWELPLGPDLRHVFPPLDSG